MTGLEDTLSFLRVASRVYITNRASLISFSTTLHIISINLITASLMDKVADVIDQASRQKPPVRQPAFSNLTLPSKYDHLNLVTRLWLQSRIIKPKEWEEKEKEREKRREEREREREKRKERNALESDATQPLTADSTGDSEKSPLGDADRRDSRQSTPGGDASSSGASSPSTDVTSVDDCADDQPSESTTSRGPDDPVFRAPGSPRPKTLAEIWVWLDLCRELSPYLGKAVRLAHPLRLMIYLLEQVSGRLLNTGK